MPITTYAGDTFFTSLFNAFTTGWEICMSFIQSNTWILICVGTPVVLGLASAVISFIKSRM